LLLATSRSRQTGEAEAEKAERLGFDRPGNVDPRAAGCADAGRALDGVVSFTAVLIGVPAVLLTSLTCCLDSLLQADAVATAGCDRFLVLPGARSYNAPATPIALIQGIE